MNQNKSHQAWKVCFSSNKSFFGNFKRDIPCMRYLWCTIRDVWCLQPPTTLFASHYHLRSNQHTAQSYHLRSTHLNVVWKVQGFTLLVLSLLFSESQGFLPWVESGLGKKLTTHLYPVPELRLCSCYVPSLHEWGKLYFGFYFRYVCTLKFQLLSQS